MLDRANTGDGLITALTLLEVKKTIGSLPKFIPYPMLEFNVRADNPAEYSKSEEFLNKVAVAEKRQADCPPERNGAVHKDSLRMLHGRKRACL